MKQLFLPGSPYTRQGRLLARVWTLLILIGCLTPGHELPHVDVPFIDKWVHLVIFGAFTFFWLCARPGYSYKWLTGLLFVSVAYGCVVELLQGWLTFLGRSMELMDAVADGVGSLLGIILFMLAAAIAKR